MFIPIHKQILIGIFILSSLMNGASTYAPLSVPAQLTSMAKGVTDDTAPAVTSESLRFAVIGDFGDGSTAEGDVANLLKSWDPDFVITVGDNNYPDGAASTIDAHIGQFYHEFIYPYNGTYGSGATTNRFFPALGNNDWDTLSARAYLDYFTLPGNERYYDYVWGPVHFFVIDSDNREPDGRSSSSVQAAWLQSQLTASTSMWNLVYLHHPPYSSGSVGSATLLQWPYADWGADAVLAGHSHTYERIFQNGIVYFVNGLGGDSIQSFGSTISGSQFRYNGDYGAMLVDVSNSQITFQFINRAGAVIDSYSLHVPSAFSKANPSNAATNQSFNLTLSWGASDYVDSYEYCIDTTNDNACNGDWIDNGAATSKVLSNLSPNTTYYWQVRAVNNSGTTTANDGTWWSFTTIPCYSLTKSVNPLNSGVINVSPAPNCNGGTQYLSGTVLQLTASPNTNYAFDSWSGDLFGSSNPVMITMDSNKSATALFTFSNVDVYIGGIRQGRYYVPSQTSLQTSYGNLDNGPVKIASTNGGTIIASQRINLKSMTTYSSYTELMGIPAGELTDTYLFPWYNNANSGGLSSQLRFGNVGNASTVVTIKIAGVAQVPTYTLAPNESARVELANVDNGPVEVISSGGVPIIASLRINLKKLPDYSSYTEFLGLSASSTVGTKYTFPWYNNATAGGLSSQLRFGNVGNAQTTVTIKIAGVTQQPTYTLAPNESARVELTNVDSGPVEVFSSAGVPIIAAMRVNLKTSPTYSSYSEFMGLPGVTLTETRYLFPWYNNATAGGLSSQLRFANVGNASTVVSIKIGGVTQPQTYTLAPNGSARVELPNVDNGPVEVFSNGQPIIASIRVNLKTSPTYSSYSEFMGLSVGNGMPGNELSTTYWFPWYNNATNGGLSSQLRFGVP